LTIRTLSDGKISPFWTIRLLAIIIGTLGLVVIFGWVFDIGALKSILPSSVTMKFSTAVSFMMTGTIIYLLNDSKKKNSEWARVLIPSPIMVIAFYMMTLLVSSLFGTHSGIENLFEREGDGAIASTSPGIPSIFTMILFLLVDLASLLVLLERKDRNIFMIGAIISTISTIAITGYVINVPILYYNIDNFSTAMALHTSIAFMLAGVALMLISRAKYLPMESQRYTSIMTKVTVTFASGILPTLFLVLALRNSEGQLFSTLPEIITIGAFVLMASILISRIILNPIIRLKNAAIEMQKGIFCVEMPLHKMDEIGDLTSQFLNASNSLKTAAKKLEDANTELKKMDRQKSEFSAMITHELKSSLVPINGYLDLLLAGHLGELNEAQKTRLKIVRNSSANLQRLISDILDVQKLEMGVLKLYKSENDIFDLINETLMNLRPEFERQKIFITTNLNPNVKCFCDRERIQQVLVNLLNNAMDFCPKNSGKIEINLVELEGNAKITVIDNGKGIPLDKLDKIFLKFYQIDPSSTREHGGTGIGLSICKGLIEDHGGKIWAESIPGRGAIFNIKLPITQPIPKKKLVIQN